MSQWRDRTTGEVVERPDDAAERTSEWYARHNWVASTAMVERLAARAVEPVFLCGSPSNADELLGFFVWTVCLVVDEPTLRRRLAQRTTNDFGRTPDELAAVLSWHGVFEEDHRRRGAVMIDARRPLAEVVDDVVGAVVAARRRQ